MSLQNYDEAMAYILPVKRLEFKRGTQLETATHTPITLAVRMLTFLNDEADETMFTDCADVPYNIALSDTKNFAVEGTSGKRGLLHFALRDHVITYRVITQPLTIFIRIGTVQVKF